MIIFAFPDNPSAENSKSSADFSIQLIQLLECMVMSCHLTFHVIWYDMQLRQLVSHRKSGEKIPAAALSLRVRRQMSHLQHQPGRADIPPPPRPHQHPLSVPNSSYGLIFVKNMGTFWAKIRRYTAENTGKIQVFVILSSFCDLVHIQRVIDLFAKQINNALKPALNHQNTGKITKIQALYGRFPTNARIYRRARIYTGDLGTLLQVRNNAIFHKCLCIRAGPYL